MSCMINSNNWKKSLHVLSHDPNKRLLESFKMKYQARKHQMDAEQTQFPMTKHNTYFHRTITTCASGKAMKGLMFPLIQSQHWNWLSTKTPPTLNGRFLAFPYPNPNTENEWAKCETCRTLGELSRLLVFSEVPTKERQASLKGFVLALHDVLYKHKNVF